MEHIGAKLPKIFILENVVGITSKQHVQGLAAMFQKLRKLTMGPHRPKYVVHATILNSRLH
jgi:site-specific DNA-cytosine methylase